MILTWTIMSVGLKFSVRRLSVLLWPDFKPISLNSQDRKTNISSLLIVGI